MAKKLQDDEAEDKRASFLRRIEGELRELRQHGYDLEKAPIILKILGGGDPIAADVRFRDLKVAFRNDKWVTAALEVIQGEGNVQDRLNRVRLDYGVEEAGTIRRWVDKRGIPTLARYLATNSADVFPVLTLTLFQHEPDTVSLSMWTETPPTVGEFNPGLGINGEPYIYGIFEEAESRLTGRVRRRMKTITVPADGLEVQVSWAFETRVIPYLNTHTYDSSSAWWVLLDSSRFVARYRRIQNSRSSGESSPRSSS